MPCEKKEAGIEPQVVEEGEVQESSYAVKRVDCAEDQTQIHSFSDLKWGYEAALYNNVHKHWVHTDLFKWRFIVLHIHALGMYPVNVEFKYFVILTTHNKNNNE